MNIVLFSLVLHSNKLKNKRLAETFEYRFSLHKYQHKLPKKKKKDSFSFLFLERLFYPTKFSFKG